MFINLTARASHSNRLIVRLKSNRAGEASDSPDDRLLTIPWHKPPSKKSRQILLHMVHLVAKIRPAQFERGRAWSDAIARGGYGR